MRHYILKKVLLGAASVFVIVSVVFLLMRMLPADYFFTQDQIMKLSEAQKEDILVQAGLRDPLALQLLNYWKKVFSGDLGISRRIETGLPVVRMIGQRAGISVKLGLISMVLSVTVGVLIGVFQTVHRKRLGDHIGTAYTIFVNAVPTIVSYSLILFVGTRLFGLPSIYSSRVHPISSLILPVVCLSLTSTAGYALWSRRYMIDEINKDYIKLAKMKGLSEKELITGHVLRNAIVPLVQYLPTSFLLTVGGSLLVETFFSIPGMGPLLADAVRKYDVDVVQSLMLVYSTLSVFGVILGDLLMCLADPRIRMERKEGVR